MCFAKKINTDLEKLAPSGWQGWHVFATLVLVDNISHAPLHLSKQGNSHILLKTEKMPSV